MTFAVLPQTSTTSFADQAVLNWDRFRINMAIFANLFPDIHARLAKVKQPRCRLVAEGDDDYDIEFAGTRLYGGGARVVSAERVAAFFRTPEDRIRLILSPPDTRSMDIQANQSFYRAMKRAVEEAGASFSAQNPSRQCFHLVVMGIGLAEHLPLLFKETRCRHLLLAESNIEFLYWSLFTFDWRAFFTDFLHDDRVLSFNFIDVGDTKAAATSIRGQIRAAHPAFIDGSYLYLAYRSSFLEAILRDISENRSFLLAGLGFLEDEIDMVRNSYRNLVDFSGRYFRKRDQIQSLPAFVVASGPSLDNDLEFIRQNADRAVIVSCGTTLRILLRNGIRPDFHMEMENVPAVYDLLSLLGKSYPLKDITLVASTTIDPRVKSLFDNVIFYFRAGLASYPMFNLGPESGIPSGVPTVANLGLSFAQIVGCRAIYLFGVDLGTRDVSRHHAKDAPYNAGEVEFKTIIDQPVRGNFGGIVFSEFIYLWSRDMAQSVILANAAKISHYNCSDGVRIDGATPKLSRSIALPAPTQDKQVVVDAIAAGMPEYTRDCFDTAWTNKNLVRELYSLRDAVLVHCRDRTAHSTAKNRYPLAYMARVVRTLIPRAGGETADMHYYRGTLFMAMIGFHYYSSRITDPAKRRAVLRIMRGEFIRLVEEVAERVVAFYRELDPEKTARDEKEAARLSVTKPKSGLAAGSRVRRSKSKSRAKAKGEKHPRSIRRLSPRSQAERGKTRKIRSHRRGKNFAHRRSHSRTRR